MRSRLIMLLMFAAALPQVAAAQAPANYFGLDLLSFSSDSDTVDESLGGVAIKLGRDLTNFIGVEAHVGTSDEEEQAGFSYKIDYFASLFGRFNLHLNNNVSLYAIAGGSYVKTSGSATFPAPVGTVSLVDDETGLAYGAGVQAFGDEDLAINLGWVRYLHLSDATLDAFNIGVTYYFDWPRIRRRY